MSADIPEVDISLRDGRVVHIRAMRGADEADLLQAFGRMSDDALYMRFMRVAREPNIERLRTVLASFPESGIGLAATVPATDGVDIVGNAIAIIESKARTREFAISVATPFGGSGLAMAPMKTLSDAARRRGLQVMEGFVLAENESMLRLAKKLGFGIAPDPEGRAVRICRLPLSAAVTR